MAMPSVCSVLFFFLFSQFFLHYSFNFNWIRIEIMFARDCITGNSKRVDVTFSYNIQSPEIMFTGDCVTGNSKRVDVTPLITFKALEGKHVWLTCQKAYDLSIQIGSTIRSCDVNSVSTI
ncbi:uncharacterized protein LOC131071105 [Cryptomeria japonica]|uniref:uncharacterized protein LOC131071105 n=1 Tax=Cryptomeria japonica TaxID=3369 RepID=UPI0027DA48F4|nr:uncharacterized protein LOC131071105 [Cryptomeria japonica]